ncbi:hypothetical protein SLS62_007604 [Diatrype stigma]|uniref:Ribosomal RNA-processing protein 43 n=1 Tax=Diatrype stigma TaxID=117547 RepID=A0AAN9UMC6_9PEZI
MAATTTTAAAAPPNNNSNSNNLTLSSTTFAKLSPHPYLLANLQPPPSDSSASTNASTSSTPHHPPPASARANGRQPRQARPPNVNTSSLSHAHGSAVVRTGDTTVICGVRGETLAVSQIPNFRPASFVESSACTDELRDYDLLVPNIELATGCAPTFLPGAPPTALAQTLSTRVYSLLHGSGLLDAADLRIYEKREEEEASANNDDEGSDEGGEGGGNATVTETAEQVKAYWVLYIDLLFISFDGNPFDAAWAAVVAALRDARLPQAHWDPDREAVLCARAAPPRPLRVRGLPVACTAAVFTATRDRQRRRVGGGDKNGGQYWVLVDPDRFEESLCDETVTVVVDRSTSSSRGQDDTATRILGISKSGGTVVGPQVLRRLVGVAEERWLDFKTALG